MLNTPISIVLAGGMALLSAAPVAAVNLTYFEAAEGVEPAFRDFITAFYTQAEDPAATDAFTAFFTETASFNSLGVVGTGYEAILADKQSLCPATAAPGTCLDHVVNVTRVFAETPTNKTYLVNGAGKIDVEGTCRLSWFQTQLTVAKDAAGVVGLTPATKSVEETHVAVVQQVTDPCDII